MACVDMGKWKDEMKLENCILRGYVMCVFHLVASLRFKQEIRGGNPKRRKSFSDIAMDRRWY